MSENPLVGVLSVGLHHLYQEISMCSLHIANGFRVVLHNSLSLHTRSGMPSPITGYDIIHQFVTNA